MHLDLCIYTRTNKAFLQPRFKIMLPRGCEQVRPRCRIDIGVLLLASGRNTCVVIHTEDFCDTMIPQQDKKKGEVWKQCSLAKTLQYCIITTNAKDCQRNFKMEVFVVLIHDGRQRRIDPTFSSQINPTNISSLQALQCHKNRRK